jgi:PAS domain S-box-containing protein
MKFSVFHLNSLKTRVTLFTLAIFVLSIWSLALYASHMLRDDLQALLSEQQLSTASMLGIEINHEMSDRLQALEIMASEITPALLQQPFALQTLLAQRQLLSRLFNDGVACADTSGTVLADFPQVPGRIGSNFRERDYFIGPLQQGLAWVGKPVRSKLTQNPIFVMAVPIKDDQGRVMGVLAGVVNLGKANFLTEITDGHFGNKGDYFVISRQHRLVVASSNQSRIMAALPAPGLNPAIDRHIQGQEGTDIFVNPLGFAVLTSIKMVPVAGWYVGITLATQEAFAPIHAMQQRIVLTADILTLLAAVLTWWMLRRELAPLFEATDTLARLTTATEFPSALPIPRQEEIGHLIAGFNQLLKVLHEREAALRQSEERFGTLIKWTPQAILVHRAGKIVYVNPAAVKLLGAQTAQDLVGRPSLDLVHTDSRQVVLDRIRENDNEGSMLPTIEEKLIRLDGAVIDVEVTGIAINYDGQGAHQVALHDVTERKRDQQALQNSLRDKVALLNEVHHRVKNNLQVIASLLRLEAGRSSQDDTKAVLKEMQGRIYSMALLHESLYRSGIFASVDLGNYIRQLATQAFRANISQGGAVRLQLDLASVQVSLDQAAPCGLLVNELVSNALKHGFPEGYSGEIRIALQALSAPVLVSDPGANAPAATAKSDEAKACGAATQSRATRWCLRVSDTGIGLPADFETRRGQSLGLQLVGDLTRQLAATLEIGPGPGAVFVVTFAIDSVQASPESP